jgi:hypothetical protein
MFQASKPAALMPVPSATPTPLSQQTQ